MDNENILEGIDKQGESEVVTYIRKDEKIEIEVRDVFRIRPQDLPAFKHSLEEWSAQWD